MRVSAANMNAAYITADLTNPAAAQYSLKISNGRTAFRVMDGLNHSTIHDPNSPGLLDAVIAALTVDDAGFGAYVDDLNTKTHDVLVARQTQSDEYYWGYNNAVFMVRDQFYRHVDNYFVEFFNDHPSNFLEEIFHKKILQNTHPYSDDGAYRSMLIDTKTLGDVINKPEVPEIKISLTAEPEFSVNDVGYSTLNDKDISAVVLARAEVPKVFRPNHTTLIEVIIRRQQKPAVFAFNPF